MFKYFYKNNVLLFIFVLLLKALFVFETILVAIFLSKIINSIILIVSNNNISYLLNILIYSLIFSLTMGITMFLDGYFTAKLMKKIFASIRIDLMKGILNNEIAEYEKLNSGDYISLFNHNIKEIEIKYFKNILDIYTSILTIIFAIIILVSLNIIVAILSIFIMAIPTLIPKIFNKSLIIANENIADKSAIYNKKIKEIFDGYEVIKSYSLENIIYTQNKDTSLFLENSKFKNEQLMSKLYAFSTLISMSAQFIIMIFSGYFSFLGLITVGDIVAITQLSGQVITPISSLSAKFGEIKGVKTICDDLLEKINKVGLNQQVEQLEFKENDTITFENVTFAYNDERNILKDFNYSFEFGKKYAIVGETGSGKSTIFKLIMQYFNDYSGNIFINNKINSKNILTICSYLQQNQFLFDDTIKNNISLFKDMEENDILNATYNSCLTKLINRLENGINEKVGENGNLLSGGERQRICIARALANKKPILLMDEATSALDNDTANFIENNILNTENLTYISITHRLKENILKRFDKILVMKEGQLIEEGTFQELIENKGYFCSIY